MTAECMNEQNVFTVPKILCIHRHHIWYCGFYFSKRSQVQDIQ